jgi:hypothetical protein
LSRDFGGLKTHKKPPALFRGQGVFIPVSGGVLARDRELQVALVGPGLLIGGDVRQRIVGADDAEAVGAAARVDRLVSVAGLGSALVANHLTEMRMSLGTVAWIV